MNFGEYIATYFQPKILATLESEAGGSQIKDNLNSLAKTFLKITKTELCIPRYTK